jgi:selenium metabolism protein YedF
MHELDARHLACPGPVIELRRLLSAGEPAIRILVADELSSSNVTRFAASRGARSTAEPAPGGGFAVTVIAAAGAAAAASDAGEEIRCEVTAPAAGAATAGPLVVQLAGATMGRGDDELGALLLRSFLKTLLQLERRPDAVVCYNAGVTLCCAGAPTVDDLARLVEVGVEVLACGTCLNFFALTTKLAVGRVTDMLEIATRLAMAGRVISP